MLRYIVVYTIHEPHTWALCSILRPTNVRNMYNWNAVDDNTQPLITWLVSNYFRTSTASTIVHWQNKRHFDLFRIFVERYSWSHWFGPIYSRLNTHTGPNDCRIRICIDVCTTFVYMMYTCDRANVWVKIVRSNGLVRGKIVRHNGSLYLSRSRALLSVAIPLPLFLLPMLPCILYCCRCMSILLEITHDACILISMQLCAYRVVWLCNGNFVQQIAYTV